jgi:hypothetical protein
LGTGEDEGDEGDEGDKGDKVEITNFQCPMPTGLTQTIPETVIFFLGQFMNCPYSV